LGYGSICDEYDQKYFKKFKHQYPGKGVSMIELRIESNNGNRGQTAFKNFKIGGFVLNRTQISPDELN
jgi:hypothetical protein